MTRAVYRIWMILLIAMLWNQLSAGRARAQGFDRIRVGTVVDSGNITEMDAHRVQLNKGALDKEYQVNEIVEITYAREPGELTLARSNAAIGGYQTALEALDRIEMDQIRRPEIRQDIEFYRAYCMAKLAIAGEGDLQEAGTKMHRFIQQHKNNYHYYEAVKTLGDVLVAWGSYNRAQEQYAILAAAPWDDFKLKAAVLEGHALVAQKKYAEAIQRFDAALAMKIETPAAEQFQLDASLGKATSLAESGQVDQAVGMVTNVIERAEPEAAELHARAYNALGHCYLKAGQQKDALLAFLHVDVLYSGYPAAHAEALYHLASLWEAIGQGERARQARELLSDRYPNSRWIKQ